MLRFQLIMLLDMEMGGAIGPQAERRRTLKVCTNIIRDPVGWKCTRTRTRTYRGIQRHGDKGAGVPCSPSCDISLTLLYNMGKKQQQQQKEARDDKDILGM